MWVDKYTVAASHAYCIMKMGIKREGFVSGRVVGGGIKSVIRTLKR